MKSISTIAVLVAALALTAVSLRADDADSITVDQAIRLTLQNNPAIERAQYAADASGARIDVTRSDRYPDVTVNGNYTRIGPVPEFDLPGEGKIAVAPYNNYDFHLGVHQTLYDFGKTDQAVRVARTSHQAAADNVEQSRFALAYRTVDVFYTILILERRISVLDEQLRTLGQHLDMTTKKLAAGTATDFDTLTIQVRIAATKSNRIDAARALQAQEIAFRQLTGLPPDTPVNLSGAFQTEGLEPNSDSLLLLADQQRPEMVLARDAEQTAEARTRLMSLGDRPHLSLNLSTGFKNGYEPNLNTWRGNYAAGIELKVPIFNGYRTRHEVAAATSEVNSAKAHTADLERRIKAEVLQAVAGVTSNREKMANTEIQVYQAEQAVAQARVKYDAGVITNLDLLDAETTLSESKLIRLRAYYDYTISLTELDRAIGRKRW